jgi:phage shock protein PspC (stress-responsive transcriptional regulator)
MERIAVTVRLNGATPILFDSAAYERLERYLADSAGLLEGDPAPQEILGDLESAIAERCEAFAQAQHAVVTLAHLEGALAEIGSVQTASADPADAAGARPAQPASTTQAIRPLQQVSEGAVVSGVCVGLARYFGLDVTLLRILMVILLLATGGGMILVYLALMLLMPYTPLQRSAAKIGWLPAKCRHGIEYLQSKLGTGKVATS